MTANTEKYGSTNGNSKVIVFKEGNDEIGYLCKMKYRMKGT